MATKKTSNYHELSAELDDVINQLQNGQLDVDQAADAYEKGMLIIQKLEKHLQTVENKVTKIKANLEKS